MSLAREVFTQIDNLTKSLLEVSFCDYQNKPVKRPRGSGWDTCQIEIPSTELSVALKNMGYEEMYEIMSKNGSYNFRLLDGALIVLLYDFEKDCLLRHTLAYYPNPNLLSFQENEEIYLEEVMFAEIVDKRVMIVPIRFDYDRREGVNRDIDHPISHFTLGQFENCRIPVTRPLMPCQFVHFILRNFYNTAYISCKQKIYYDDRRFDETISENEKKIIHVCV